MMYIIDMDLFIHQCWKRFKDFIVIYIDPFTFDVDIY
jgi:hypothetical protein